MLTNKKSEQGFTFVEILVFTSILSFLLIALTTTVVTSLQRMTTVEHRLYAQRYAEELQEWLRGESQADWTAFIAKDLTPGSGTMYCFNGSLDFRTIVWPTGGQVCAAYNGIGTSPPLIYKRYAVLTAASADQMNVQIVVEWKDGNHYFSTPLNTVFTNAKEN
jgi:type II secretory pathway pseudopilin PulG